MEKLTRIKIEQMIAIGEKLNFVNTDLSNLDLSNLDLSGAFFYGADLQYWGGGKITIYWKLKICNKKQNIPFTGVSHLTSPFPFPKFSQ